MSDTEKTRIVKCPQCGRRVPWTTEQLFKPFCCERCKLIDLGEWAAEENRIPGDPVFDAEATQDEKIFH
ncbi:MAG: hypothetical protein Kow0065_18890 [Methylomicrobium sp.]